jgi:hypothetical protein
MKAGARTDVVHRARVPARSTYHGILAESTAHRRSCRSFQGFDGELSESAREWIAAGKSALAAIVNLVI